MKLAVLPLLVNKHLGPARFIGVYNGKNPLLFTDRVTGSVKGGIGFIRDGGIGPYVPNTLLGGDMRQYITDMRRVAITYRKATAPLSINIVYAAQDPQSRQKILVVRGISNGLEQELTFRLVGDRWMLVKLVE